jgi:hypothetical protein
MMADIRADHCDFKRIRHAILGALAHRRQERREFVSPPSVFSRQRLDVELMSGVSRSSRVLMNPVARLAAIVIGPTRNIRYFVNHLPDPSGWTLRRSGLVHCIYRPAALAGGLAAFFPTPGKSAITTVSQAADSPFDGDNINKLRRIDRATGQG